MGQTFLTEIKIKKVRHLENIIIPLSDVKRKHLIFTGKNGSGKTSVLEALRSHFDYVISSTDFKTESEAHDIVKFWQNTITKYNDVKEERSQKELRNSSLKYALNNLHNWTSGAVTDCTSFILLREKYEKGQFIIAYYAAERKSKMQEYNNIEKVQLKDKYKIFENPGTQLTKYMVNLKATQAFAQQQGKFNKIKEIEDWFERFENMLRKVFEDASVSLDFDIENYQFQIIQNGKEPFDFNTMSSGYAAVFDIISDIMMRMEFSHNYNMEGIILIDEIETHLHLELQKKIMPMLTELFPNLQFIVSTHSPFILSSIDNAVIYDLESKTIVQDGLANLPYEGIVEGYFGTERLSKQLKDKFKRYRQLVSKNELTDEEFEETCDLSYYLDEIPDYLAPELTAEYERLKLDFENRE